MQVQAYCLNPISVSLWQRLETLPGCHSLEGGFCHTGREVRGAAKHPTVHRMPLSVCSAEAEEASGETGRPNYQGRECLGEIQSTKWLLENQEQIFQSFKQFFIITIFYNFFSVNCLFRSMSHFPSAPSCLVNLCVISPQGGPICYLSQRPPNTSLRCPHVCDPLKVKLLPRELSRDHRPRTAAGEL